MSEQRVALLRGINLGSRRRVAMGELRELLSDAGYGAVRTHLQSGNVLLAGDASPTDLEPELERLISDHFGFQVDVVVRTRDELAEVVARNPLADVARDPKRYQVSFLAHAPDSGLLERLQAAAAEPEQFVLIDRELYAWHPDGVRRSRLWARLATGDLGVKATARNWSTVTALLALADQ